MNRLHHLDWIDIAKWLAIGVGALIVGAWAVGAMMWLSNPPD